MGISRPLLLLSFLAGVASASESPGAAPFTLGRLVLATKADVAAVLATASHHATTSAEIVIAGMLKIEGSELTDADLAPLVSLITTVMGPIVVADTTEIKTLDWLNQIRRVQGSLVFRGNLALSNGCALQNLRREDVARIVAVRDNANPISLPAHLLPTASGARPVAFPCGGEQGDVAVPAAATRSTTVALSAHRRRRQDTGTICEATTTPPREDGTTVVYFREMLADGTLSPLPDGVELKVAAAGKTAGTGSDTPTPASEQEEGSTVDVVKEAIATCGGKVDPADCGSDADTCGSLRFGVNVTAYCPVLCDSCTEATKESGADAASAGPVIGGVVGAIVVVGLLIAAAILIRKKQAESPSGPKTVINLSATMTQRDVTSFDASNSGLYDGLGGTDATTDDPNAYLDVAAEPASNNVYDNESPAAATTAAKAPAAGAESEEFGGTEDFYDELPAGEAPPQQAGGVATEGYYDAVAPPPSGGDVSELPPASGGIEGFEKGSKV